MSVTNCQSTPCKALKQQGSHLHRGESLTSTLLYSTWQYKTKNTNTDTIM